MGKIIVGKLDPDKVQVQKESKNLMKEFVIQKGPFGLKRGNKIDVPKAKAVVTHSS